jgi:hypothetical protein
MVRGSLKERGAGLSGGSSGIGGALAESGQDLAQVKATWSRLVFTGKASPPKELPDAAAVKKAVAADPKAIGYIEKSEVDSTVKVLLSLN